MMDSILICSDNDRLLTALRPASGPGGVQVTVCRRLAEVVQALLAGSFDRLILDLETPGLDSLFLLAIVRRIAPHLPVVAVSSRPGVQVREIQQKGIAYHLVPPTGGPEFAQVVTRGVEAVGGALEHPRERAGAVQHA